MGKLRAMKFRGSILVTGASTGIGRACALQLDALGFRVFATAISAQDGAELQSKASAQLEIVALDLRDADSIAGALQTVSHATGEAGLVGLVNNAGILSCAPLELMSMATVKQVFEINVVGQIALTQAFLPLLRAGKGRIVGIGSLAGRSALPYTGPYNASKWAFRALNDTWRLELKRQGIAVILVEPGMVATPIWKQAGETEETLIARQFYAAFLAQSAQVSQMAQGSTTTPDDIARVVVRALTLAKPRSRYTIGSEARLLLAVESLPTPLRDWLVSRRFGL